MAQKVCSLMTESEAPVGGSVVSEGLGGVCSVVKVCTLGLFKGLGGLS